MIVLMLIKTPSHTTCPFVASSSSGGCLRAPQDKQLNMHPIVSSIPEKLRPPRNG